MTSSSPKTRKSSTKSKAKRGSKAKKAAAIKVVPKLSKTPPPFRNKVVDKKGLKNQNSPKTISAMRNKKIAEIIKKREN